MRSSVESPLGRAHRFLFFCLLMLATTNINVCCGFVTAPRTDCRHPEQMEFTWQLYMGKGMNKQAELKRKMELAKKQKAEEEGGSVDGKPFDPTKQLSAEEMKERNDRLRFEELLKNSASTMLNDYSSGRYLNQKQEEEEITARRKGVDRLFEGDPAPTDCFQDLHHVRTESTIGKAGMERLVPWINSNNKDRDYIICLTDPRFKSPELRQSVKTLWSVLPKDLRTRLVVINADSPAENRRWLKRNNLLDPNGDPKVHWYCDEKMNWMRAYTALGGQRWSMTLYVLANGRVEKLAREVDVYSIDRVVQNAVQAYKEEKRL